MSRPHKAETGLQAAIVAALELERDLVIWRNATGVYRGYGGRVRAGLPKGSADLVGILAPRGRFVALEVKRPGEEPEPHQIEWLDDVRARGGFACVVHSMAEARDAITAARRGESTYAAPVAPTPTAAPTRRGRSR